MDLVQGLKVKLDHVGGSWMDKLLGILWSHRTTPKEGTRVTPFNLIYGGKALVHVEIGMKSSWVNA